jgi:hypothetical protein
MRRHLRHAPTIRAATLAGLLVVFSSSVFADMVIGTRGQIGTAYLGANLGRALESGIELARTKAAANAQFAAARRRFFTNYPNGRDFAQADKEFASLLWEKDLYFLWISLPTGFGDNSPNSFAQVMGQLDKLTGGTLDNGIPGDAGFEYGRWVTGIRQSLGAKSYRAPIRQPSAAQLAVALKDNEDLYLRYKKARDEAEFEMQCRARPGPYCGGGQSRGHSKAGDMAMAARIADYYLDHYAQDFRGEPAVKSQLRDAIIKYESLSYGPKDCIRSIDQSLAGTPRHGPNMAALRSAIAKYEKTGVMSPEDVCIRAAQDMQRDEDRRGGHRDVAPTPKELWDASFRTEKFIERYGPLTEDQAREMAGADAARAESYRKKGTLIDYYLAKAPGIRDYRIVRGRVIERAAAGGR